MIFMIQFFIQRIVYVKNMKNKKFKCVRGIPLVGVTPVRDIFSPFFTPVYIFMVLTVSNPGLKGYFSLVTDSRPVPQRIKHD